MCFIRNLHQFAAKTISMLSSSAPPSATQASPRFSKGMYIYIYTDSESHWTINDQPNNILKQNRWFNFNLNFIAKSQKLPETLLVRQVDFVELALDHQILEIEDVEDVDVTHWHHWPPWKKNGPEEGCLGTNLGCSLKNHGSGNFRGLGLFVTTYAATVNCEYLKLTMIWSETSPYTFLAQTSATYVSVDCFIYKSDITKSPCSFLKGQGFKRVLICRRSPPLASHKNFAEPTQK